MRPITTIGIDLAKKVFQVHGVNAEGKVVVARKLRRKEALAFFANLPRCLVGMEACGSAHYWGREIAKLGHAVKLMPPKYVKAYVKRGKTDDAAAICEAVTRPSMSFVPMKGLEQQGLSMVHSARSQLIGQRTQLINGVRRHLSELGIIATRGRLGFAELAAIVRHRAYKARQYTAQGEQGERAGRAPRDDPLGPPGDCKCIQGPGHRRGAVQERPAPIGMDWHRAGERFDRRQGQAEGALQEGRPLSALSSR
jgi:transposase